MTAQSSKSAPIQVCSQKAESMERQNKVAFPPASRGQIQTPSWLQIREGPTLVRPGAWPDKRPEARLTCGRTLAEPRPNSGQILRGRTLAEPRPNSGQTLTHLSGRTPCRAQVGPHLTFSHDIRWSAVQTRSAVAKNWKRCTSRSEVAKNLKRSLLVWEKNVKHGVFSRWPEKLGRGVKS